MCQKLITPPANQVLPGVTRHHVMVVARRAGFEVLEQDIKLSELSNYDAAFLTSTSAKILPLKSVDKYLFRAQPPELQKLITAFSDK